MSDSQPRVHSSPAYFVRKFRTWKNRTKRALLSLFPDPEFGINPRFLQPLLTAPSQPTQQPRLRLIKVVLLPLRIVIPTHTAATATHTILGESRGIHLSIPTHIAAPRTGNDSNRNNSACRTYTTRIAAPRTSTFSGRVVLDDPGSRSYTTRIAAPRTPRLCARSVYIVNGSTRLA